MNEGVIYRKSAQGAEAIANKDRVLTPRLRALLILVDGKRPNAELAKLTMQENVGPLMDQLLQMGMVEQAAVAPAQAAPASAAPPAAAPAPGGPTVPLADAKRFAVRRLTDMLGPAADDLCLKLEGAKSAADFMIVLQRVEAMLRNVRGDRDAEKFIQEMESHRPA